MRTNVSPIVTSRVGITVVAVVIAALLRRMPQSGRTLRLLNGAGVARGPSGAASHLASQRRPRRRVPGPKWLTLCALLDQSSITRLLASVILTARPKPISLDSLVLCHCESGADETGQGAG